MSKGTGIVRFGWSNHQKRLIAGSSNGIYENPPDLSKRAYLREAKAYPDEIIVGAVIKHITIDKQIITLSKAVIGPDNQYNGAITGTINLEPLLHVITKQMGNSHTRYQVHAPKGETISKRGPIDHLKPLFSFGSQNGFRVTGHTNPLDIRRITLLHITQGSILLIVITTIICAAYLFITRFILRPVESTVTALESILPHAPMSHKLSDKLNQITRLAERYAAMQMQLQTSEQKLTESHELIASMSEQQQGILSASSAQMEQTFSAIARYTEHIEEMIIAQRMDEDQQFYFDDVKEMGDNLQLVSSAFYRICAIKEGSHTLKHEAIDLSELVHHSTHLLNDALDRRNQSLKLHIADDMQPILQGDASIVAELLYSLLYSAIHFAEDEAQIDITLTHHDDGWHITHSMSHYRRSVLPPNQQDFSAFAPSASRDVSEPLHALIMQHMNIWIARSFLALHKSDIEIDITDDGRITFNIELTDREPVCSAMQDALSVIH